MKIFGGSSNIPLANKAALIIGQEISPLEIHIFPDGEKRVRVVDRVVDEDCVIIQSCCTPADQNYMELFFIVDALARSGAKSVTAVIPYLGYQRQDHIFRDGEAVSLEVIVKTLEAVGISSVMAFDFHSIKIPEMFKVPVHHLSGLPLFAQKIKEIIGGHVLKSAELPNKNFLGSSRWGPVSSFPPTSAPLTSSQSALVGSPSTTATPNLKGFTNTILITPDMGGIRRIKQLSELLGGMPYASIVKDRDLVTGGIESKEIELPEDMKSLEGRNAIIVDDMISSGGTIVKAVELLKEKGVNKIFVFATHAVFSQNAPVILQDASVENVFVTDTILTPADRGFPKLEILSVAGMIAAALQEK